MKSNQIKNLNILIDFLKSKRIYSPRQLAIDTLEVFRNFVSEKNSCPPEELAKFLISYTEEISECCIPHATVAENIALRILKIAASISPCAFNQPHEEEEKSLQYLLTVKPETIPFSSGNNLRECCGGDSSFSCAFEEDLEALNNEIHTCMEDISSQALQHIHTNEIIMVYGHSGTIEHFLKNAGRHRKFRVIVCQAYPDQIGLKMVKALSLVPNIEVTLIPDSCIYAMMARVNKVILSCYAITADGGLCSRAGTNALALSAADHDIPILVCTGLYKLSPRYQYSSTVCGRDVDYTFPVSPRPIIDYLETKMLGNVEVYNPSFDYIPASLISLFITNRGTLSPSYMYRLLKELYPLNVDY